MKLKFIVHSFRAAPKAATTLSGTLLSTARKKGTFDKANLVAIGLQNINLSTPVFA
jgi:hypothetical protein